MLLFQKATHTPTSIFVSVLRLWWWWVVVGERDSDRWMLTSPHFTTQLSVPRSKRPVQCSLCTQKIRSKHLQLQQPRRTRPIKFFPVAVFALRSSLFPFPSLFPSLFFPMCVDVPTLLYGRFVRRVVCGACSGPPASAANELAHAACGKAKSRRRKRFSFCEALCADRWRTGYGAVMGEHSDLLY